MKHAGLDREFIAFCIYVDRASRALESFERYVDDQTEFLLRLERIIGRLKWDLNDAHIELGLLIDAIEKRKSVLTPTAPTTGTDTTGEGEI